MRRWPRSSAGGSGRRPRGPRPSRRRSAPLRGYMPNSLAGPVEITSTQRSREIRPPTTPPSCSRSTRSSTPGRPLGIFRKSPRPSSFWPWKSNGQWSVETTWRSSLRRPAQSCSQCGSFGRSGGEQTNLDPSNPLPRSSRLRNRYCGQVSAKAWAPRSRASRTASSASRRRQVDDVDRHAGRLGQPDHAVGRLALEDRVARDAVVVGVGLALGDELGGDDVDGRPVLGVHHDQAAVLRGLLHRPEDRGVVAVEHARVGGEQLEVGDALGDQLVHLGEGVVGDVAHDHVEAVVDDGVALGLGVPRVEAGAQALALRLDREVDDARRPAERRRARPRLERVLGERAAERQLHVGVDVDRARDDVLARRVDGLVGRRPARRQARPDLRDRLAVHEDVRLVRAVGRHDRAVGDQGAHAASSRWTGLDRPMWTAWRSS